MFFPTGLMIANATRGRAISGLDKGSVGFDNYATLFAFDQFWRIIGRTIIWVVAIVDLAVVLSLGLAQILNKAFPGRQSIRLAVIIPWAASVVMTTIVFDYGLEPCFGEVNKFFVDIELQHKVDVASALSVIGFLIVILVVIVFVLPYLIMFFGSVKSKSQIRSTEPAGMALGDEEGADGAVPRAPPSSQRCQRSSPSLPRVDGVRVASDGAPMGPSRMNSMGPKRWGPMSANAHEGPPAPMPTRRFSSPDHNSQSCR